MILVLSNGERVVIHRLNCGHQYKDYKRQYTRAWNINPIEIIDEEHGFFVIGEWGTEANEYCERMIPIRSVVGIENPTEWEKEDVLQIRKVLPDISTLRKRMDNIEVGS
jgi:hypothetical protein